MNSSDDSMIFKKAGALLARRYYSRHELRKMLLKMAPAPQVDRVLDRLEQLSLLNDMDYAYNLALCRMCRQGWSPVKVKDYLLGRGFETETVESVLNQISGEFNLQSALMEYAQKRLARIKSPIGPADVRKLILHLRRRGFEEESIQGALWRILSPTLWKHFETGE